MAGPPLARAARVAALYDVHGNLPALDAVLAEVERADPDLIVVGGDLAAGPMPVESIERVLAVGRPVRAVRGNADRELVEAFDAGLRPDDAEGLLERGTRWAAARLSRAQRDALAAFEPVVRVEIPGLGSTLFCHGSPRSDREIVTAVTPEARLAPMLEGVDEGVVVLGHTHRQFDRTLLGRRIVNAGAVGMPYEGEAGAYWALLGPDVELRRTRYALEPALAAMRATGFPEVDELILRESLVEPADPDAVAAHFEALATRG